ncbi:thermonuclease family protein [Reyranella soli]|uniref:thermonuclease family protein n=1 Tax=Reyranella soli TaxID=1230389 RepID=UPI0011BEE3CD
MGKVRLLAAALTAASPCAAQTITDGDTLKQGGLRYRLWGVDAPELAQTCPDGWPAGRMAAIRLQALTAGRSIVCQEKDRDRYGRTVAICRASGEDLGALMAPRSIPPSRTCYRRQGPPASVVPHDPTRPRSRLFLGLPDSAERMPLYRLATPRQVRPLRRRPVDEVTYLDAWGAL